MHEIAGSVALFACALFAGAAAYVSWVEHPARMESGLATALAEFVPSYRRASVMQASLAALATLGGLARWALGGGTAWLVGAACIFAVIPFTLVVIMPTNKKLLDPRRTPGDPETGGLLATWARLHAVRTLLGLAATVLFLVGITRGGS
jgi:hypothetical protein